MLKLPLTHDRVAEALHEWINFLAKEDYKQASFALPETMPAEELIGIISSAGGIHPENGHKVTLIEETVGGVPRPRFDTHLVDDSNDPSTINKEDSTLLGEVLFDLPLNNKWSELTALFVIRKLSKDLAKLEVEDIRVM